MDKQQQKKLITEIMNEDAKDWLYHIGETNKMVEHHIVDTNKMITAVQWLINRFNYIRCIYADDMEDGQSIESAINIAREMEKLQIINAFKTGEYNSVDYFNAEYPHQECSENYYNETYNK